MNRLIFLGAIVFCFGMPGIKYASAQFRGVTRPFYRCEIPFADYQFGKQSATVSQLSESALPFLTVELRESFSVDSGNTAGQPELITPMIGSGSELTGIGGSSVSRTLVPGTREQPISIDNRSRLFQFSGTPTEIDHCSISNIAVWIDREGRWSVNLTATQNGPENIDAGDFSRHLKRNQFYVKLRFFGAYTANAGMVTDGLSRPQLGEVRISPFWVERGQPQSVFRQGGDRDLARQFNSIDRVEVEFFYK